MQHGHKTKCRLRTCAQNRPPNHRNNKPRTIVAKFSRYKDRETVRKSARNLRGSNIGIHEQYSRETNEKRNVLYPEFKKARSNNRYAKLVHDYLIIDSEKFKVDNQGRIYKDPEYHRPPPPPPSRGNNHHFGNQRMDTTHPPGEHGSLNRMDPRYR